MLDEIFGAPNFITTIIWEKRTTRENRRVFSFKHDFIVVYAMKKKIFEETRNKVPLNDAVLKRYKNLDNDPRGPWQSVSVNAQAGHATADQFYKLQLPSGREIDPPPGRCWLYTKPKILSEIAANNIWFGKTGNNVPRQKKFLDPNETGGLVPETIFYSKEVATNDLAKKHSNALFNGNGFDSPKPEQLLKRILEIASNPGDLILDTFAGSGTTGAVAHKMGRKHISVEMGEHAHTHIVPRYRKVIEGEQGGISADVGWQGGSGFRYCTLGEPLFDADGNVNAAVSFPDLAAHVFFCETGSPIPKRADPASPLIGSFQGRAIYLLHNADAVGVASDNAGNVLTGARLDTLPLPEPGFTGARIVYGEGCTVPDDRLIRLGVTFKQIPYQIEGL
jgi:adenine specific DNA methylase Mod